LAGETATTAAGNAIKPAAAATAAPSLAELDFGRLCKIGLAFTWPLLLAVLGVLLVLLERK
jgi:hypothetical protein